MRQNSSHIFIYNIKEYANINYSQMLHCRLFIATFHFSERFSKNILAR